MQVLVNPVFESLYDKQYNANIFQRQRKTCHMFIAHGVLAYESASLYSAFRQALSS
jgi:hypothetical protein